VSETITVEVAFASPDRQALIALIVPLGTTVKGAIEQSNISAEFPEIDLREPTVGIFGKLVSLGSMLRDRDRVEIYRPLIADPKIGRRRRAENRSKTNKIRKEALK
jgi:putative ubiquitin-RnfH superfamily antitoxin RatB of RatAB toxin-antitoxin module